MTCFPTLSSPLDYIPFTFSKGVNSLFTLFSLTRLKEWSMSSLSPALCLGGRGYHRHIRQHLALCPKRIAFGWEMSRVWGSKADESHELGTGEIDDWADVGRRPGAHWYLQQLTSSSISLLLFSLSSRPLFYSTSTPFSRIVSLDHVHHRSSPH